TYPAPLPAFARRALERLGVSVWAGSPVPRLQPRLVRVRADQIQAGTILWAAGVAASPLGKSLGAPVDRVGRVLVNPDLTVPGRPDIVVAGDLAALKGKDGAWLPGVAQVAMQQARHASKNILEMIAGRPLQPFAYFNFGNMATIGRNSAVADFGWLRLKGYLAWLAWLFVHLVKLIGFRSR